MEDIHSITMAHGASRNLSHTRDHSDEAVCVRTIYIHIWIYYSALVLQGQKLYSYHVACSIDNEP